MSGAGPRPSPVARRGRHGLRGAVAGIVFGLLAGCGGGDNDPGLGAEPHEAAATCGTNLPAAGQMVYVSTLGSDAAGCGQSTATACRTLAQGIANCGSAGCSVLVRHGLYPASATIVLRDGVNVYGSCRFDGEPDRAYRTTIQASPPAGMPAILAASVNAPTVVSGLVVVGKDEIAAGTASLGVVVRDSKGLMLTRNVLASSRGGDGQAGTSATAVANGQNGGAGTNGGGAGPSCAANPTPGAGAGGHGGTDVTTATYVSLWNYDCRSTDAGSAGQPSGDGTSGGTKGPKGAQGIACGGRPHDAPASGLPGGPGVPGACGGQAQASPWSSGRFDGATWVASRGDDGQSGAVGAGGGGGGAGGACVTETQGFVYNGLPGGGGGGGGCGGPGGTAGQQGGASIALALVDSSIAFDAGLNSVIPGPGGVGGKAGDGIAGGAGGAGGPGQTSGQTLYLTHWCGGPGSNGGPGGAGGAGSAGAGGHGGPSIGVARVGATGALSGIDAVYPPRPGLPGRGGGGGSASPGGGDCTGPDGPGGVPGLGAASFDFTHPPQNFLAPGQSLASGESRTSLNGQVQLLLRTDGNLCLYGAGRSQLWCSAQAGLGTGQRLTMQVDGDLCLSNGPGSVCVASSAPPGAYLLVKDDGHAVVSDGTTSLWSAP